MLRLEVIETRGKYLDIKIMRISLSEMCTLLWSRFRVLEPNLAGRSKRRSKFTPYFPDEKFCHCWCCHVQLSDGCLLRGHWITRLHYERALLTNCEDFD